MSLAARKIRLTMHLMGAGIHPAAVSALERVPREAFIGAEFEDKAYEDVALPIGHGQTISQPLVVATMIQALGVGPQHRVLEIGTGSGYLTAILSNLARRVYTIEFHRELLAEAERRLTALGCRNLITRAGDGSRGWPEAAPFDRIIASAAASEAMLEVLAGQLGEGGVMVAPWQGAGPQQRLLRVARNAGVLAHEDLGPTRFVPMQSGVRPPRRAPGEGTP